MRRGLAGIVALSALVMGACSFLPAVHQDPPKPCNQEYSVGQCLAMVDVAAAEVGRNRGDVAAIAIVPDPPPEGATLGGAWPIHVRIALKDGSTHESRMCGGVSIDPACKAEPHLQNRSVFGGYRDIPAGSTPVPTLEPSSVKTASPIEIDSVSIPIERQGNYEVVLGEGSLPNGVWSAGSFEFAEQRPNDLALREGVVLLDVRSLEPGGKPFDNYYAHGWHPGVERIRAVLTFDVLWFAPGATLEIRNVVVR